jgi:hypothetical protein
MEVKAECLCAFDIARLIDSRLPRIDSVDTGVAQIPFVNPPRLVSGFPSRTFASFAVKCAWLRTFE